MSVELLEASLSRDRERAAELLDAEVPPGWPDIPEIPAMRRAQLVADPDLRPWLLRSMRERAEGRFIGHVGFHTGPGQDYLEEYLPGRIEFGYAVFASHRRRGYAREAALGLMNWALRSQGITRVVSISPRNDPSQRLARSLGFVHIGRHLDEVDGEEDVPGLEITTRHELRSGRFHPILDEEAGGRDD